MHSVIPKFVSLQKGSLTFNKQAVKIPIEIPPKPTVKKKLLVCLKAIYIPPNNSLEEPLTYVPIVEWFELNKILGVDHITAYIHSISTEQARLFHFYVKQGFLDLLSAASPPGWNPTKVLSISRSENINDCLYRNMYAYHKIMIIDTDEFIVPQKEYSVWNMMVAVAKRLNVNLERTIFALRNQIYYTDDPRLQHSLLQTQFAIRHRDPEPVTVRAKMILDPNVCFFATSHRCSYVARGAGVITPMAEEAVMHHYKACNTTRVNSRPDNCTHAIEEMTEDTSMQRFGVELEQRVLQILEQLSIS
jgi:hypothetical protein